MENIQITKGDKDTLYKEVLPQIDSLISYETDIITNLANIAAVLKQVFDFYWVGFYVVKKTIQTDQNKQQLVLGPFQGPLACTRINYGRGVCGTAWEEGQTIIVPDVDQFPGHIACSSASKSEIVIPIKNSDGSIYGVLDIDSDELNKFDNIDAKYLQILADIICKNLK